MRCDSRVKGRGIRIRLGLAGSAALLGRCAGSCVRPPADCAVTVLPAALDLQALGDSELKDGPLDRAPGLRRRSVQVCDVHRRLADMTIEVGGRQAEGWVVVGWVGARLEGGWGWGGWAPGWGVGGGGWDGP